jgi:hypothetical protein
MTGASSAREWFTTAMSLDVTATDFERRCGRAVDLDPMQQAGSQAAYSYDAGFDRVKEIQRLES